MRIAAFQCAATATPSGTDVDGLIADAAWADAQGVDLALFPECHLSGHAYDRATIAARAIALDDAGLRALLVRLAPVRATLILGLFERRPDGIYNSALVVEAGRVTGRYAKAHPNEDGVLPGRDTPVFRRSGRSFGINICNDANHPAGAQALADRGASLLCYPLANLLPRATADRWRDRSVENLQARARQTGCWVLSADVVGAHDGRYSHGCTLVAAPDGGIVARAGEGIEDRILYDLPRTLGSAHARPRRQ